jgi:hypothetical protein
MFQYCGNNPVSRLDADGREWWHWLVAAVVVVAVAAVVVATAGGAGVAIGAVLAVSNGVAAATTGSTIAACALVGSATALGASAVAAASSSSSVEDFNAQGSWVTVGVTTGGAALGALGGYLATKPAKAPAPAPSGNCFVAGTLIATGKGKIPIEEIEAGDLVYSENPETGEAALKAVVRTFVRETDELVHIFVSGEEIVTTPEHPFWQPKKGWTNAIQLRAGDILVNLDGKLVVVAKIQHEILESPRAVYNFEVEDFHAYFVGDATILVHNASCGGGGLVKGRPAIPSGYNTLKGSTSRNVNSSEFRDFMKSIGQSFRSSDWTYKMEIWVNSSGQEFLRHFWTNHRAGISYYHK